MFWKGCMRKKLKGQSLIFSLPPPSDLRSFPPREINKLETPEDESEIGSVIMANMQPLNIVNSQQPATQCNL